MTQIYCLGSGRYGSTTTTTMRQTRQAGGSVLARTASRQIARACTLQHLGWFPGTPTHPQGSKGCQYIATLNHLGQQTVRDSWNLPSHGASAERLASGKWCLSSCSQYVWTWFRSVKHQQVLKLVEAVCCNWWFPRVRKGSMADPGFSCGFAFIGVSAVSL